jgi:hypothetical protein
VKKFLILSCLVLAGCSSELKLIAPEYKIVKAPAELYNCPVEKKFPKADTLTERQVGVLLLKLQRNNVTCKNSLDSIQRFYDEAEKTVNEK